MGGPPQKRPRNLEISELCPKGASPQRSDGHLGEAEGVDQTFLYSRATIGFEHIHYVYGRRSSPIFYDKFRHTIDSGILLAALETRECNEPKNRDTEIEPRSAVQSGDLISSARFTDGSPHQGDPYDAEYYPENRRSTHDKSPPRSGFLSHKIALVALIYTVCLVCLGNAVRFFSAGLTEAGIVSWVIGGLGIMATSAVGVPLALELGPPSIPRDGGAYEYRNNDNRD